MAEREDYSGYASLIDAVYRERVSYHRDVEILPVVNARLEALRQSPDELKEVAGNIDSVLGQVVGDERALSVLQKSYGLNPYLGQAKSAAVIAKDLPRPDGTTGVTRDRVRQLKQRGLRRLYSYQRTVPIAGLSFQSL